jgi:putative sigma-54 modulation protein
MIIINIFIHVKGGKDMKVIITSKNVKMSDYLKDTIEKKFEKLDKYFSDDVVVNVVLTGEKKSEKMEATIVVNSTVFRAEYRDEEVYSCIEKVVDKLAKQMSRFKDKLVKKHKGHPGIKFEELVAPVVDEPAEEPEELKVVKSKKLELVPLTVEEAIVEMELVGHNFYVFKNSENNAVNVVYKRENEDYGLLETV